MPEVTSEMWDNAAQAASEPGIHNPSGIRSKAVEAFNKSKDVVDKFRNAKVFGFPVGTFLMGAVAGGATRAVLKGGLTATGLFGGIGLAATAGAGYEIGKEYLKQRSSGALENGVSTETGVKAALKNELLRLKNTDKKKLAIAAGKGAVMAGLGFGVAGYVIPEAVSAVSSLLGGSTSVDLPTPTSGGITSPTETPTITPTESVTNAGSVATATEMPATETPTSVPITAPEIIPTTETPGSYIDNRPSVSATTETPGSYIDNRPSVSATTGAVSHPEVKLPSGSNPWNEVEKYMTDELSKNGKTLTESQLKDAVARALVDSNIQDATKLPVGYTINLSGADEIVKQAINGTPLLPIEIARMPDTISLPAGSNPWEVSKQLLITASGNPNYVPTNFQIAEFDKELCIANGFAAPELGVSGDKLATQLQVGQSIKIGPLKQLAVKIVTK